VSSTHLNENFFKIVSYDQGSEIILDTIIEICRLCK
jgi:hypothetical protein